MRHHLPFYVVVCLLCPLLWLSSCKSESYHMAEGLVWNTQYHITYRADKELSDSIIAELKRVELSVSAFNPNSIVSKVNRNEPVELDGYFIAVYSTSVAVANESGGAFDPTLAPLINFYGFGYQQLVDTDSTEVAEIMKYIGIEKTSIKDRRLIKTDARVEFNFSALAKGYGCDRVAALFERNGVNDYLIEIGGEIRLKGNNTKGEDWRISIDRPVFSNNDEIHDSQMILSLTDCAVATSGNYRNFKIVDGRRVVHTIDRFTGKPALNDLLSATIIIPQEQNSALASPIITPCMLADAYATACMSMGSQRAKDMITKRGIAAMFILADGSIWKSPAFPAPKL